MNLISLRWVFAIFFSIASIGITISEAQEVDQAKWTATGNLLTARVCHTATLLPDGRVLVLGGYGIAGELASAELYDPKEGVFTRAADMTTGRCSQTATLLSNGQVLVVGGQFHGNTLSSAELYNPTTNTWTTTGSLHVARSYHTATLLPNGQVLVVGGARLASPPVFCQGAPSGSALDIAELYNPATGKWTVTDNLHTARFVHTATLLSDGEVLVTGGLGTAGGSTGDIFERRGPGIANGSILANAELYNPKTGSWKITENLPTPLFDHFSILLPDGQVLIVGGKSTMQSDSATSERYNPSNGIWNSTGSSQMGVRGPCILLPDSKVLVAGGASDAGTLNAAELYDPKTGTWNITGLMNKARCLHTATLLKDGSVLVTGGLYALGSPTNVSDSAELYNAPEKPNQASNPTLTQGEIVQPAPSQSNSTVSSLFTLTMCLIIFTGCLVVLTACVVILLCAWLVFALVRRWGK